MKKDRPFLLAIIAGIKNIAAKTGTNSIGLEGPNGKRKSTRNAELIKEIMYPNIHFTQNILILPLQNSLYFVPKIRSPASPKPGKM